MNIWLDDCRTPPVGEWKWVKTVKDTIDIFEKEGENIEYASLDHDLDFWDYSYSYSGSENSFQDGIEVVRWMVDNKFWTPKLGIHTDNPHGRKNMTDLIDIYGPYNNLTHIVYEREPKSAFRYPAILYEV